MHCMHVVGQIWMMLSLTLYSQAHICAHTHTGPLLMQEKVDIIHRAHGLEGDHYCVGFHMSVVIISQSNQYLKSI